MRIALLHPFVWPEVRRGAERYADDLAWYLRGRGHEVDLVAGTTGPSTVEQRPDGVAVRRAHHVGMVKLGRLGVDPVQAFGLTITSTLRQERYDVAHAMVPSAAIAARVARTPVVFTFIGHPTAEQFAGRRRDLLLHRAASRAATRTTALSEASAASVHALFGRRPTVLPPGVRVDRFSGQGPQRDGPTILFSAAPGDPRKRLDLLLAAFATVRGRWPSARLAVSGQGDARWALDSLGPERDQTAAAVDLLGAGEPDELPARYAAATVTVLPAVDEAFGLSVVESLASGTPVVCADDAGMVDIVDRADVGRTFRSGDVTSLAQALDDALHLAADPQTADACRQHARRWDWTLSIGPQHEAMYDVAARQSTDE